MRLTVLLFVAALPCLSLAQSIIPADIRGQPLMYMKDGTVNGCGVRVLIADLVPGVPVVPVYALSFNLFQSYASVKGGSYDVLLEA